MRTRGTLAPRSVPRRRSLVGAKCLVASASTLASASSARSRVHPSADDPSVRYSRRPYARNRSVKPRHGFGGWQDVIDDTRDRFGEERARRLENDLIPVFNEFEASRLLSVTADCLALPTLLTIPEPLFLDAVWLGFRRGGYSTDGLRLPNL